MRFSIPKDYILEIGSGIDKWDILQWYQDMHNLMNKWIYKWPMHMVREKIIDVKPNYMY